MATSLWAGAASKTESIFVALVILLLAACGSADTEETAAVRASFYGYKQAILDQDGKASLAFVDTRTIAYYQKMSDLALRGDREIVRALSAVDKLMVLTIRHMISLESVETMTGESLFVQAVNQGLIGEASVINNDIGDISVSGTHATGVHVSEGKATRIKWVFQLENDRWRLDMTSIMPAADQAFQQVISESGLPEDEFLMTILESVSGKKVGDTVWDPMVKP